MQCPSTASVVSKMLDVKLSALESADNTLSFANLRRERRRHQRRRRASAQHSPWDPADDERSATGFGSARTSTDDSVDAAVATADASTDDAPTSSETASTPSSARGKASRSTSTADSSDMASLLSSDDDDDGASTTLGQMLSVIGTVCDSTLVPGDAVDASAPYDVAWWSIFPTVERLWVRRKLSRGFSDEVRALCTHTHTHTRPNVDPTRRLFASCAVVGERGRRHAALPGQRRVVVVRRAQRSRHPPVGCLCARLERILPLAALFQRGAVRARRSRQRKRQLQPAVRVRTFRVAGACAPAGRQTDLPLTPRPAPLSPTQQHCTTQGFAF